MEVREGLWCLAGSRGWFVAFEQIMGRMGSALEYQGGNMQGTRSLVWKCQATPRFQDTGAGT